MRLKEISALKTVHVTIKIQLESIRISFQKQISTKTAQILTGLRQKRKLIKKKK